MLPLLLIQLSSGVAIVFNPYWALNANQIVGPVAPQPETH